MCIGGLIACYADRIWRLALLITGPEETWHGPPPGAWCVALALQDAASPPTWLDARLFLLDANFNATSGEYTLALCIHRLSWS